RSACTTLTAAVGGKSPSAGNAATGRSTRITRPLSSGGQASAAGHGTKPVMSTAGSDTSGLDIAASGRGALVTASQSSVTTIAVNVAAAVIHTRLPLGRGPAQ